MYRRALAWSETAVLFIALYAGLPLAGRAGDAILSLPDMPLVARAPGAPLLGLGAFGLGWSLTTFAAHGGTPNPIAPSRTLITTGPFAWTRNPVIVSHFLGALGACLLAGTVVGVVAVFALGAPSQAIVRHEEAVLEGRFGDAYRAYRARVPRWVPRRPG